MTRNDRGELPWQLALKVGAPVPVVMLLLPAPEHLLWANIGRELAPEVFADAICQRLSELGKTEMLPHYRTLSNALRARRYQLGLQSVSTHIPLVFVLLSEQACWTCCHLSFTKCCWWLLSP